MESLIREMEAKFREKESHLKEQVERLKSSKAKQYHGTPIFTPTLKENSSLYISSAKRQLGGYTIDVEWTYFCLNISLRNC